jgi:hypothetical protein
MFVHVMFLFKMFVSFHFGLFHIAFDAKGTLIELVLKLLIAKICIYKILGTFLVVTFHYACVSRNRFCY